MDDRVIFHIDVNSAFLSWEAVHRLQDLGEELDLRTIPSAVGGDMSKRHGVILAKSIPAKKYNVRTGEPIVDALRKCPNLTLVSPNRELYARNSAAFMEILRRYSDTVEQYSIDEAFADMTGTEGLFGSPIEAAHRLKDEIRDTLGFTVNVGISSNKLLAKMAGDFEKPDKVHTLFLEEVPLKMWPLPVGDLFMAGRSSVETLNKLEIYTIGDLANADVDLVTLHLKSHGRTLWEFANGIGSETVHTEQEAAKGIGNSTTLAEDVSTYEGACKVLRELAESVSRRLKKAGQKARMVNVEIKYHDFQTLSHQTQVDKATNECGMIHETACKLFSEAWSGEPVRLLGIRTSKLMEADAPQQLTLFDIEFPKEPDEKHKKLNAAMEAIRKKYGEKAVVKGSEMTTVQPRVNRNVE